MQRIIEEEVKPYAQAEMALESYLTEDESPLEGYQTNGCKWVVTNQRVLKYSDGEGTKETFHDLSLGAISSISVVRTDRDWTYVILALITGFIGFILLIAATGTPLLMFGSLVCFGGAVVCAVAFLGSDKSYYQFRGTGITESDLDIWRMNASSTDEFEEVKSFAQFVRRKANNA